MREKIKSSTITSEIQNVELLPCVWDNDNFIGYGMMVKILQTFELINHKKKTNRHIIVHTTQHEPLKI